MEMIERLMLLGFGLIAFFWAYTWWARRQVKKMLRDFECFSREAQKYALQVQRKDS